MKLRWISAEETEIIIETPSADSLNPQYIYQTHSGFGGADSEISSQRGAYQDGEILKSVYLTARRLSIQFYIIADSLRNIQVRRRLISRIFNSRAGLGTLIWTQEDGTEYAISCIADSGSPSFTSDWSDKWQHVIVDFVAPDPCWYAYPTTEMHLAGLSGGAVFPAEFPIEFATQGATRVVENLGGIPAPIRISIAGPITNPVLENLTTGQKLELTLDVASGESVEIDTTYGALYCRHIATDGTQTNAMPYLSDDSEFWQIEPGENVITYSATSGSAEVMITFASRYTGV